MNKIDLQSLEFVEASVFVLEPDDSNRPVYVGYNANARKRANLSITEIVGKTAAELYPGGFGMIAYDHHCKAFASGQTTVYGLTLPIAGSYLYLRTHLTPVFDEKGVVCQIVGTSEDVTAEHTARPAQTRSVALDSKPEECVDLAAHGPRSPVKQVRNLKGKLRENLPELDEGQSQVLAKLELLSEKAQILINDVLGHSENNGSPQSIEGLELLAICRDIMQLLKSNERRTEVNL